MIDGDCSDCFFAVPSVSDDDDLLMKCRRFPPLVVLYDGELCQAFPDAANRCGEYRSTTTHYDFTKEDDESNLN